MRLGARAALVCVAGAAASSCAHHTATLPPNGQLVLYVDTDAPLPAPIGSSLGAGEPPPLFDRLRIDVVPPGASEPCAVCSHEFDVDRDLVGQGRASIGVTPPVGATGYRVRVRLFRAAFVEEGEPRADATLETVASLPPIASEGLTEVTVVLHTDDVARPVGTLDDPVAPIAGRPSGALVGTWAPAHRRPCAGAAGDGEVCVPGGAYWMGNPLTRLFFPLEAPRLRLVALSPFFLDATEVTVERLRDAHGATDRDPMRYDPLDGLPGPPLHCTYQNASSDTDDLPVNCISWERARAFCATRGGDLPTEAQFQYVAGGLASRLYVWGDDPPSCDDAVYARSDFIAPELRCPGQWVEPAGSGKRDRLVVPGGGVILDVAGNVTERLLDRFQQPQESCWGTGVFHDPVCTTGSANPSFAGRHSLATGSFVASGAALAAAARGPDYDFTAALRHPAGGPLAPAVTSAGFRCARSGE